MKKFCFVLVMILLLVGCSSTGTDKSKSQEEHRTITFDGGYEKIAEFKSMLEKDDKELEEYLIKNRYYANNIQTRIDVEAFFEMLNRTYFPVMEKANNTCVIIYPWDEAWIRYESSHGASYGLRVCINSDTAEEEIQSVRAEVKDRLSENINKNKAAEDIKIYSYAKEKSDDDPAENFYMDVRGVFVGVRVFNEPDFSRMSNTLQEVQFLRLDEILENLSEYEFVNREEKTTETEDETTTEADTDVDSELHSTD